MKRRQVLKSAGVAALGATLSPLAIANTKPFFEISLAQWSLHRQLRSGELPVLDFARKSKEVFGISAVEYVNQFFADKANDQTFLRSLKQRADDNGVQSLLIMIDGEGHLGDVDNAVRGRAVENHFKWCEAAKYLGCYSIRVNITGSGDSDSVQDAAVDGLSRLCAFASMMQISVIVENNVGFSSNGNWLEALLQRVALPNCGALPDFGNFGDYDRYKGVEQLMPFAKGISAKSFAFDDKGKEVQTDFERMLKIIKQAGYSGHIGVEYEGAGDEDMGVMATKNLLLEIGSRLI